MSPTTFAWLVLLFPLLGSVVIALGYRVLPGRAAGWIGTAAIGLSFAASIGALVSLLDHPDSGRQLNSTLWNYASAAGLDIKLDVFVDPLSVFMILVVSGV